MPATPPRASPIRVANAPCSWGALEFEEVGRASIGYVQMLDELRETGYVGTELGDWGFMPTEPSALDAELRQRGLAMVGAYVQGTFRHADAHAEIRERAVRTARLLRAVAEDGPDAQPPFLILADENGSDPVRTLHAGRATPGMGLDAAAWRTFAAGVEDVARAVNDATGLRIAFHSHCAGFVETPDETARLLDLTSPDVVGLVLDTGHYTYGSGVNDPRGALAGLERFAERVLHVHVKDCEPAVATRARADGWDYFRALKEGLFCELGKGCVDFPAVVAWLRERGYGGWIVVEQDVLPGMGSPKESAARSRAYLAGLGL
ncbi:MAG: TIM barrel protein [Chloroflexi bacterium]|nr:TIM barrel protein [Chloroflexota bacterium]